ncbi:hypothetical protein EYR41_009944 [Orbilia oligospora]|uniref:Tetratricopeptide repeat protein n=1 Tax=Orbilia oligospora TaxID=2813651 RepID=A0A8H2HLJ9_ORBOL|nr:hypothetical protein EYR41_009944 [Orbilia oligospora]
MAGSNNYPFNLGDYTREISTGSEEAQHWFNHGLNWCFGFNHEEGMACFQNALEADPKCVMAHWGIAYASGPFYNLLWCEMGELEAAMAVTLAHSHLAQANALAARATPTENRLIAALAKRFELRPPALPADYDRCEINYVKAMREVQKDFPEDQDVAALFVEALITRTPRRLWDMKTGEVAAGADTIEALEICEKSIDDAERAGTTPHPAIIHLHIHLLEMSHMPERAMQSADRLRTLCPDAGHMNHMPGHIYLLCGEYEKAKLASEAAIKADDIYSQWAGSVNFYVAARCHHIHLMMYTCMFLGQYEPARAAAEKMKSIVSRDILTVPDRPEMVMRAEGYYAMAIHMPVRFGKWKDIIDTPAPDDPHLFPVSTVMHHYARGVAYAALKKTSEAERERILFHETRSRVPPGRRLLNNTAVDILAIAELMLDGEIAYRKGDYDEAFVHLRKAVEIDENLNYCEPWAWMHPPRHALGALLLEQGHSTEAEQVYREDLGICGTLQRCSQHRDNIWALHGLVECLQARGDTEELAIISEKLEKARLLADTIITSSCMCRLLHFHEPFMYADITTTRYK